jgi:hypothetical protein
VRILGTHGSISTGSCLGKHCVQTGCKSPDDKLVEAFVETVQDEGGCAPLNIPVPAHFKGFLEVVEADQPKRAIQKLWEISACNRLFVRLGPLPFQKGTPPPPPGQLPPCYA